MALYDRLLGRDDSSIQVAGKIPLHAFTSLMGEFGRGRITGQQAQDAITQLTGIALDATGVTEAQTLLGTITGTATAKLARAKEIEDVLLLGEHRVIYPTPSLVKTRLGV
jgi:hypothetical protein